MVTRSTGSGQSANVADEGTTEGHSTPSPKTDKPPTKKRHSSEPELTVQEVLTIMENALQRVKDRVGPVRFVNKSGRTWLLLPTEIAYCDQCGRPFERTNGAVIGEKLYCDKCKDAVTCENAPSAAKSTTTTS